MGENVGEKKYKAQETVKISECYKISYQIKKLQPKYSSKEFSMEELHLERNSEQHGVNQDARALLLLKSFYFVDLVAGLKTLK